MIKVPEFIEDATNVYRTKNFIVKQCIGIQCDDKENNVIFSHDTFYKRTRSRDKYYESVYRDRKNINGKRLPTTMHARNFID
ncbi:MAG: hypothetical protein PHQ62_03535 [Clostridia bacterium]|nr:hypothetical protein [Clostridia bacterium]